MTRPFNTRKAPSSGLAVRLTSGTSRSLPGGTPLPVCHWGRPKKMLLPPPLLDQPDSSLTVPSDARLKLVPPTPTTNGSEASYSSWVGPDELCPVWSGFDPDQTG